MTSDDDILGFDYGQARIGVARVNKIAKIVEPLTVIGDQDGEIKAIIEQYGPTALVVGLPRNLSSDDTEQTKITEDFINRLKQYGLPVYAQDEALTTTQAEEMKKSFKPEIGVDAIAAAIILQDYVEENLS